MLQLSEKWAPLLLSQPETGMGYQIATVTLKNGRRFPKTIIDLGWITKVGDNTEIPFNEADIAKSSLITDAEAYKTTIGGSPSSTRLL